MKHHAPIVFFVIILIALVFSGCATVPVDVAPVAQYALLDKKALQSAFGANYLVNPYLEPATLLVAGKRNEFVVLRFDLRLPSMSRVNVSAKVTTPEGVDVAFFTQRADFLEYLKLWPAGDSNDIRREKTVLNTFLPGYEFQARRGARRYYLVLMGGKPIPRPAMVSGLVTVDGQNILTFETPLPPATTK